MGAFLRNHAGVIQAALGVVILLLLIVWFSSPVYWVACTLTVLAASLFRAWLSYFSIREEAREEGRRFLGWAEPAFLNMLDTTCYAYTWLLVAFLRQFPALRWLWYILLAIGWVVMFVLALRGEKVQCQEAGKPFIWYRARAFWLSLLCLALFLLPVIVAYCSGLFT